MPETVQNISNMTTRTNHLDNQLNSFYHHLFLELNTFLTSNPTKGENGSAYKKLS